MDRSGTAGAAAAFARIRERVRRNATAFHRRRIGLIGAIDRAELDALRQGRRTFARRRKCPDETGLGIARDESQRTKRAGVDGAHGAHGAIPSAVDRDRDRASGTRHARCTAAPPASVVGEPRATRLAS